MVFDSISPPRLRHLLAAHVSRGSFASGSVITLWVVVSILYVFIIYLVVAADAASVGGQYPFGAITRPFPSAVPFIAYSLQEIIEHKSAVLQVVLFVSLIIGALYVHIKTVRRLERAEQRHAEEYRELRQERDQIMAAYAVTTELYNERYAADQCKLARYKEEAVEAEEERENLAASLHWLELMNRGQERAIQKTRIKLSRKLVKIQDECKDTSDRLDTLERCLADEEKARQDRKTRIQERMDQRLWQRLKTSEATSVSLAADLTRANDKIGSLERALQAKVAANLRDKEQHEKRLAAQETRYATLEGKLALISAEFRAYMEDSERCRADKDAYIEKIQSQLVAKDSYCAAQDVRYAALESSFAFATAEHRMYVDCSERRHADMAARIEDLKSQLSAVAKQSADEGAQAQRDELGYRNALNIQRSAQTAQKQDYSEREPFQEKPRHGDSRIAYSACQLVSDSLIDSLIVEDPVPASWSFVSEGFIGTSTPVKREEEALSSQPSISRVPLSLPLSKHVSKPRLPHSLTLLRAGAGMGVLHISRLADGSMPSLAHTRSLTRSPSASPEPPTPRITVPGVPGLLFQRSKSELGRVLEL